MTDLDSGQAADLEPGFTPKRTIYRLRFTGDLEGLVVRAASTSLGAYFELTEMADAAEQAQSATATTAAEQLRAARQAMGTMRTLITEFAVLLRGWNLLDDRGEPVPATAAGLLTQEPKVVLQIIRAWIGAASDVPDPLPEGSPSGGPSLEASIPMAAPSASPSS